jgi:two-component system, chemotaxis family, chemotaxis protein CheY
LRTLIVDDSAALKKVIERALRQAGLKLTEVLQAGNRGSSAGSPFLELKRGEKLAERVQVVMITTEGSEQAVLCVISAGTQSHICKLFYGRAGEGRRNPTDSSGSSLHGWLLLGTE